MKTSTEYRTLSPRRTRRGSAVLETALVLSFVLLPLTFGAVEFSYFYFVKHTIQGASREGARAAIVKGATNADVDTAVSQVMSATGIPGTYTVRRLNLSDQVVNVANVAGDTGIKVEVTYNWSQVSAALRPLRIIGTAKVVKGVTVMRKEG